MNHLQEHNTTYIRHLSFAVKLSFNLFLMSIVGVVHAVFPFIFPGFISSRVKAMDEMLDNPVNG